MVDKLRAASDLIKPATVDLCCHINRKTFNDAVLSLGLLSESDLNDIDNDTTVISEASSTFSSSSSSSSTKTVGASWSFYVTKIIAYIEFTGAISVQA